MAGSGLAALFVVLSLGCASGQLQTVTVSNDFQAARAVLNQNVGTIQLAYDVNLANAASDVINGYVNQYGAVTISRPLTITSVPGAARKIFDFGYLAAKVLISPGASVTFDNIQLRRAQVSAPVGIFAYSPGATVTIQNAEYVLQACWPEDASQFFHTQFFQRTLPGTQQATFSPSSYNFIDVQYVLPQLGPIPTGGYSLVQRNALITCLAYSTASCDFQSNPIGCLNTVYGPANSQILCSQCTCVNACLSQCAAFGIPGPSGCRGR